MIGCAQCKSLQGIVGCSEVAAMMSLKLSVRRFEISIDFRAPALPAGLTGPSGLRNRGIWLVKSSIAQYRMLRALCGFHAFIQSKLNSCGPGPTRCSGRGASLNPLVHRAANLQPLGQVISVMSRSFYEYLGQFSSHLKVFLAINGTANIKKCGNLLLAGAPGCGRRWPQLSLLRV